MSHHHPSHDHDDIPRFEPWLGVMVGSLVPAGVALFLPHVFAVPLIACTVLLFAAALVMLAVQTRQRMRERRTLEPSSRPPDSPGALEPVAPEAER